MFKHLRRSSRLYEKYQDMPNMNNIKIVYSNYVYTYKMHMSFSFHTSNEYICQEFYHRKVQHIPTRVTQSKYYKKFS